MAHALKTIRAHGLNGKALWDVTRAENRVQAVLADPPGINWKVAGLSDDASDNGQVAWLNVTVGRQRRHVRSSDKAETGRTCVFCCCCAPCAAVELSANGYSLYR